MTSKRGFRWALFDAIWEEGLRPTFELARARGWDGKDKTTFYSARTIWLQQRGYRLYERPNADGNSPRPVPEDADEIKAQIRANPTLPMPEAERSKAKRKLAVQPADPRTPIEREIARIREAEKRMGVRG